MKAVSEEYTRLNEIAHSKIPVSEDSPIYNFFAERIKLENQIEIVKWIEKNI